MAPKKATAPKSAPAKPKANTKAKITKPAPPPKKTTAAAAKTATKTKAAVEAPARGRGRPKKEEVSETKPAPKTIATKKATAGTTTTKKPAPKKSAPKKETTPTTTKRTATKPEAEEDAPALPAKKAASKKETAPITSKKTASKRKAEDEAPAPPAKKAKALKKGPVITEPPTQRLDVFVFGEGTAGELGLGTAKKAVDVKRPRLNPNLPADKVGVVQVAAGGMHVVALTHDNKILTWGVNDQGALGRDTTWEGGLKDMDAGESSDSEDDEDDNGLNPHESTPGEVDWAQTEVAEGTRWVDVTAGDSTTFALTDDGKVYGWGTFRSNEGIFGFSTGVQIASRPILIPDLTKITSIKAGANHALALDSKGSVFAWGSGQQNQLGRRVVERTKAEGLKPREFGLPKGAKKGITSIETGGYHSFAISKTGDVYSWGLNNFGETGIPAHAGEDDAVILKPQVIEAFKGKEIVCIKGASHHSIAATSTGDCMVWGRLDGAQMGLSKEEILALPADDVVKDERDRARILKIPHKVRAIKGKIVHVTASSDHNIAITREGKAWSWGFSANFQTGLGTADDVEVATMIDNTAVREKRLNGATTGGQFSIVTAPAEV